MQSVSSGLSRKRPVIEKVTYLKDRYRFFYAMRKNVNTRIKTDPKKACCISRVIYILNTQQLQHVHT